MSLLVTSSTLSQQPSRLLDKGPAYLRTKTNRGIFSQRRTSAVELLAASKSKFYNSPRSAADDGRSRRIGATWTLDNHQDLAVSDQDLHGNTATRNSSGPSRSKSEYDLSKLKLENSDNDENNNDNSSDDLNEEASVYSIDQKVPNHSETTQVETCQNNSDYLSETVSETRVGIIDLNKTEDEYNVQNSNDKLPSDGKLERIKVNLITGRNKSQYLDNLQSLSKVNSSVHSQNDSSKLKNPKQDTPAFNYHENGTIANSATKETKCQHILNSPELNQINEAISDCFPANFVQDNVINEINHDPNSPFKLKLSTRIKPYEKSTEENSSLEKESTLVKSKHVINLENSNTKAVQTCVDNAGKQPVKPKPKIPPKPVLKSNVKEPKPLIKPKPNVKPKPVPLTSNTSCPASSRNKDQETEIKLLNGFQVSTTENPTDKQFKTNHNLKTSGNDKLENVSLSKFLVKDSCSESPNSESNKISRTHQFERKKSSSQKDVSGVFTATPVLISEPENHNSPVKSKLLSNKSSSSKTKSETFVAKPIIVTPKSASKEHLKNKQNSSPPRLKKAENANVSEIQADKVNIKSETGITAVSRSHSVTSGLDFHKFSQKKPRVGVSDLIAAVLKSEMSIESAEQAVLESQISVSPTSGSEFNKMDEVTNQSSSSFGGKLETSESSSQLPQSTSLNFSSLSSSVPRSHSDITFRLDRQQSRESSLSSHSRISRSSMGADLENFFNQMGMEKGLLEPKLMQLQGCDVFDSISSLDSQDAASICSNFSRSEQEWNESQTTEQRSQQPTSVIERNARIIKWLCNVRKAKSPTKPETVESSKA